MQKSILYTLVLLSILLSSCKKYDEGPTFSLASKKERLCKKWQIEKFMFNNMDRTSTVDSMYLTYEFTKDGKYQEIMAHTHMYYVIDGKWDFINNKESILITWSQSDNLIWEIKKLEKDRLWLVQHFDLVDIEYHLIPI